MEDKGLKSIILKKIIPVAIIMLFFLIFSTSYILSRISNKLINDVLCRESISYSNSIEDWWNTIDQEVLQTSQYLKTIPTTEEQKQELVKSLANNNENVQNVFIVDGNNPTKAIIAKGAVTDFNALEREWYIGAMNENGKIYKTKVYQDAASNKNCITCSILVNDKLVVGYDVYVDSLSSSIEQYQSNYDGVNYFVVEASTKTIVSSNITESVSYKLNEYDNDLARSASNLYDSFDTKQVVDSKRIIKEKTSNGKYIFVATEAENLDFIIISCIPNSIVGKEISKVALIAVGIAIIPIALIVLYIYIVIAKHQKLITIRLEKERDSDGLTGLKNRFCYEQNIEKYPNRINYTITCVYMDVDGLHQINNTKGHDYGDIMLRYIANSIKYVFEGYDSYRIGGDEFIVVMYDTNDDDIKAKVKKFNEMVEKEGYHVSIGCSTENMTDIDMEHLIKVAERRMYEEKSLYHKETGLELRK